MTLGCLVKPIPEDKSPENLGSILSVRFRKHIIPLRFINFKSATCPYYQSINPLLAVKLNKTQGLPKKTRNM